MSLKEALTVPEGVRHAADRIAGLDRCFLLGFGRLGPEQVQALQALQRVCSGTPLGQPVSAALEALERHEYVEKHFVALAAARAAIQGAQYDALRAHALQVLGRPADNGPADAAPWSPAAEAPGPVRVWQESTRHWLMELALAGFQQLEYQTLAPFASTLEQLQGEPLLTRLAALLTGFQQELLGSLPIASLPGVPVYRWADLWTRAMLGGVRPPPERAGRKVSGTLSVLGADLRQHGYFVSCDVYALLAEGEQMRLVRVTLSSYKVDVVHGAEVWQCFDGKKNNFLLWGLSEHGTLAVRDMTLLPGGDLLWDGSATTGKPFPFLTVAAERLAPGAAAAPLLPRVDPLDRHPVQIAEPVYLEGYQVRGGEALDFGNGVVLDVAANRISRASELQPEHVERSAALLGLLRFDGGRWAVQPLAAAHPGQKAPVFTGSKAYEQAYHKKGQTLAVLQERAGKLLRKKS
jgi:hypothetical protein